MISPDYDDEFDPFADSDSESDLSPLTVSPTSDVSPSPRLPVSPSSNISSSENDSLRRWRLILGGGQADGIGIPLSGNDVGVDGVLEALYDGVEAPAGNRSPQKRSAGLGSSAPNVTRWLGDIRTYFPSSVVQVMQKDALDRLGLQKMLMAPELLESMVPDVQLVATLIALRGVIPAKTRDTARQVVRKVVEELEKRLDSPLRQAVNGALSRSVRNRRPKLREIDWNRTIRANLKHYQPEYKTIIPEVRLGYGRKGQALRDVILCIDQSGSMASSVVYAGVLGAVMASLKSVRTSLVLFDTSVVDLTDKLSDPVDLLFSTQLGGGTDINRALAYCQSLIRAPHDTILILISDLYEGGDQTEMIRRAASIAASGVNFITLLALDDRGAPSSDHEIAAAYAANDIPSFACTPDLFPDLMAAAIKRQDINLWAAQHDIATAR